MDTGSDRLVATIGRRVNVRLARGVVLAMHYVPIKIDRHQVLGRDVGVRDAVLRDHEAVLVGDPNAEVTLGVLHQTEGLGPLGNRHDLATYLNLRHRHDCCLLSRSFVSDRSSAGEQPLTKSCGSPEGSKSGAGMIHPAVVATALIGTSGRAPSQPARCPAAVDEQMTCRRGS